jgi:hypothetical protein
VKKFEEWRSGYINAIQNIWLYIDSICNLNTHKHGPHQQEHPKSHLEFVQEGGKLGKKQNKKKKLDDQPVSLSTCCCHVLQ